MALWGAEVTGLLATVYRENPDKYIIWHEVLHIFGAEDCYDVSGQNTCELSTCIMQYAPTGGPRQCLDELS